MSGFSLRRLAVFALILSPLLLLCAIMVGCATLSLPNVPRVATIPNQYTEQLDQLVIHSDFPISKQDRLLQELQTVQLEVKAVLRLPTSNEPIHIYVFEDAEKFGDFVRQKYPGFPARRAFFIESDHQLAVYAHWGDRVAEDLRHEVSHGYMHSMVHELPLWLDEGLAEHFETPNNNPERINYPHVEELRHALLNGRWKPDIAKLEQLNEATEMSQRHYAESWLWVHWMLHSEYRGSSNKEALSKQLKENSMQGRPSFLPRQAVLESYIHDLHRHQERVKPISQRVAELGINHNEELVKYLQTLPTER